MNEIEIYICTYSNKLKPFIITLDNKIVIHNFENNMKKLIKLNNKVNI